MTADTVKDIILALIVGLPAILTAYASFRKASATSEELEKLRVEVRDLKAENDELKRENGELRETNRQLAAINEEYRNQLLPALERKTQPRGKQ